MNAIDKRRRRWPKINNFLLAKYTVIYSPTSGLGTKCTNSEQRVPKSFPVIRRRRKEGKLAAMESRKHLLSKSGIIFAVRLFCCKLAHFFCQQTEKTRKKHEIVVAWRKSALIWRRVVVQQKYDQIWKANVFCFPLLPISLLFFVFRWLGTISEHAVPN